MTDHRDDVFDADTRVEEARTDDGRARGLDRGMELELQEVLHEGNYRGRFTHAAAGEVTRNFDEHDVRTESITYH